MPRELEISFTPNPKQPQPAIAQNVEVGSAIAYLAHNAKKASDYGIQDVENVRSVYPEAIRDGKILTFAFDTETLARGQRITSMFQGQAASFTTINAEMERAILDLKNYDYKFNDHERAALLLVKKDLESRAHLAANDPRYKPAMDMLERMSVAVGNPPSASLSTPGPGGTGPALDPNRPVDSAPPLSSGAATPPQASTHSGSSLPQRLSMYEASLRSSYVAKLGTFMEALPDEQKKLYEAYINEPKDPARMGRAEMTFLASLDIDQRMAFDEVRSLKSTIDLEPRRQELARLEGEFANSLSEGQLRLWEEIKNPTEANPLSGQLSKMEQLSATMNEGQKQKFEIFAGEAVTSALSVTFQTWGMRGASSAAPAIQEKLLPNFLPPGLNSGGSELKKMADALKGDRMPAGDPASPGIPLPDPEPVESVPLQASSNVINPFGVATAGSHQFTLLGDTDHSDITILPKVTENIPAMAQSGVKHLMVEYEPSPETDKLIGKFYRNEIKDEDVRAQSALFESALPETPEEVRQSGLDFAELIIASKQNGIQIHFTGDAAGSEYYLQYDAIEAERNAFVQQNAELHADYEKWMANSEFLDTLGLDEQQKLAYGNKLLAHGSTFTEFTKKLNDVDDLRSQARTSFEAENVRADRMIGLAKGEKTAVLWGSDHMGTDKDIENLIDEKLQQQARVEGKPMPAPTQVMNLYASRAEYSLLQQSPIFANLSANINYFAKENEADRVTSFAPGATPRQTVATTLLASVQQQATQAAVSAAGDFAPISMRAGGQYTFDPYVETAQNLMLELKQLGVQGIDLGDYGPKGDGADGKLGPKTESSIIAVQKALNYPESEQNGVLTPKLLEDMKKKIQELSAHAEAAPLAAGPRTIMTPNGPVEEIVVSGTRLPPEGVIEEVVVVGTRLTSEETLAETIERLEPEEHGHMTSALSIPGLSDAINGTKTVTPLKGDPAGSLDMVQALVHNINPGKTITADQVEGLDLGTAANERIFDVHQGLKGPGRAA